MKHRGWVVTRESGLPFRYEGYEKMLYEDTVFFDADMTVEEVMRSLIDHDHYPSDIQVR